MSRGGTRGIVVVVVVVVVGVVACSRGFTFAVLLGLSRVNNPNSLAMEINGGINEMLLGAFEVLSVSVLRVAEVVAGIGVVVLWDEDVVNAGTRQTGEELKGVLNFRFTIVFWLASYLSTNSVSRRSGARLCG